MGEFASNRTYSSPPKFNNNYVAYPRFLDIHPGYNFHFHYIFIHQMNLNSHCGSFYPVWFLKVKTFSFLSRRNKNSPKSKSQCQPSDNLNYQLHYRFRITKSCDHEDVGNGNFHFFSWADEDEPDLPLENAPQVLCH